MKTITYNLRLQEPDSETYYKHIHRFSTLVYQHTHTKLGYLIEGMAQYCKSLSGVALRTEAEYAVELLTMGLTISTYFGASQKTPKGIVDLLKHLYSYRSEFSSHKQQIDELRGSLMETWMLPHLGDASTNTTLNRNSFNTLINWLEATGEFTEETKRMRMWQFYFDSTPEMDDSEALKNIQEVFHWFKQSAQHELGKYTVGVQSFLQNEHKSYAGREDVLFCGKGEDAYHLNMVGAEIMNWGFAPTFNATYHKTLLVPGCMRPNNGLKCKANQEGTDITCNKCNKNCNIGKLAKLGELQGFDVYIVPHSSTFTKWLKKWENTTQTGLIAVACLLNLVPGGYEMRNLNIPAQCLLLDFCGCQKHWDAEGFATEINEKKLMEFVQPVQQRLNKIHQMELA